MILDSLLSTFSPEVRESASMKALVILIQTLFEQLAESREQAQSLQEQLAKAQEKIKVLEDELTKLRKTPKRPKFRPNKMEPRERGKPKTSSDPTPPNDDLSFARKQEVEIIIEAEDVPAESRFKGYQYFVTQELHIVAQEITYKLEVWQSPTGEVFRGKIPKELEGQHFGSTLRAFTANLYAHGVTQPAIHEMLTGLGIEWSEGHVNHILLNEAEFYSNVAEEILTAGLEEAPYLISRKIIPTNTLTL